METRAAGRPSSPGWTPDVGSGLIVACSLLLAAAVVAGRAVEPVAAMLILLSAVVAWHRWILSWHVLMCLVIGSVVFVPVKRYELAVKLPFGLEFYRLTVAMVLLVWVASLLVDPRVRLRRTPFDGPVALIVAAALCSVAVNFGRVAPLASAVLKNFTLFLSFILVFYFIASVVSTVSAVVAVTKFIASGAAVVAAFAVVEQRTGFNVFDHVRTVLPFLQFQDLALYERYGLVRAIGSADHPIALGAFLAMCLPLGFALARSRSILWSVPTVVTLMGIMATASRTPIMAVAASIIVFLWLRPHDIRPLLPLVIPLAIVIKLVAPGSIGTVRDLFFPAGGSEALIAEQRKVAPDDPTLISGRANFWPRLIDGMRRPVLGQGLGTRQTGEDNPLRNAPILDNQWLGLFLDVGIVGLCAWLWLIVRCVRRLGPLARTRGSPEGILAAAFAASVTGFAVSMLTYDSLAYVQAELVLWALLALAAVLIRAQPDNAASPEASTV
jgi:O-Antigen ligase